MPSALQAAEVAAVDADLQRQPFLRYPRTQAKPAHSAGKCPLDRRTIGRRHGPSFPDPQVNRPRDQPPLDRCHRMRFRGDGMRLLWLFSHGIVTTA